MKTALAAIAPSLLTLIIAAGVWRATPRDFVPLWSDEIAYWGEAAAFEVGGFGAGYFTVGEQPAAATFSHFGTHGPAFAVVYGSLARLVDWRPYTPYIIHLLLIPLCAAPWLWIVRTRVTAWAQAAVIGGFWPLLVYLPSTMQEPLHFGVALLLAALVESRASRARGRLHLAAIVLTVTVACLFRPTWALIVPALFWRSGRTGRVFSFLAMGAALPVFFFIFNWMTAPYPMSSWLYEAVAHPATGVGILLAATAAGARTFVQPVEDALAITLFRVEIIAALIVGALYWCRRADPERRIRLETAALGIVLVLAALIPAGDLAQGRDFRVLAPHVLFALLVVAPIGRRWALAPVVVAVAMLPVLAPYYYDLHTDRFAGQAQVRAFADAVRGKVVFRPSAASAWSNTALMHVDSVQAPVVGLPPGIGLSGVLDWEDQAFPVRSRYVLLRDRDKAFVLPRMHLTRLTETSLGTLYLNEGP